MGWDAETVTEFLDVDTCLPAVGQGALAIECRESDSELLELLKKFTSMDANQTVRAERAFLIKMEGGCQVPIAGFAELNEQDEIVLTGLVASPDGTTILKERVVGQNPEQLGELAANKLLEKGAGGLIAKVKEELESE